jgi:uncharacterized membrane protein
MNKIIKRELLIYSSILLVLILIMHPDMLSDPVARLGLMQQQKNYIHPLLYSFFVYLIIFVLRSALGAVIRLFKKEKPHEEE